MPYANSGGVKLYYEEVGTGTTIIFLHEFAGDCRSWEPQMRFFSNRYRCVCYNARGYPPSDIPTSISDYNQGNQADDAASILDTLGIEKAHIVGLSMGGFAALHFGLRHPQRALSLAVTGCGYGANKDNRDQFMNDAEKVALEYDNNGSKAVADFYAESSTRVQFQNKNPRGWAEFKLQLGEHSAVGAANTMRGYQKTRPSLYGGISSSNRSKIPPSPDDTSSRCRPAGSVNHTRRPSPLAGIRSPLKLTAFQQHYMNELPTKQKVARALPFLQRAGLVDSPPPGDTSPQLTPVVEAAGDRVVIAGDGKD